MPHLPHELPLEAIGGDPASLPELLSTVLDVSLPKFAALDVRPGELKHDAPVEYWADKVVLGYSDAADRDPAHVLIVESQSRQDKRKRFSWPVYVAGARAEYKCGATLVVFCADHPTAEWAGQTIDMGHPRWGFRPLVIGPDQMPAITDPDQTARYPALGVLSAIHHAGDADRGDDVFRAMLSGMNSIKEDDARYCIDALFDILPVGVTRHLKELIMTDTATSGHYQRLTEFFEARGEARGEAKGEARGEAKGEAKALLHVLAGRGFEVSEEIRQKVMACTDIDQLQTWLRRAARAEKMAEVFDRTG